MQSTLIFYNPSYIPLPPTIPIYNNPIYEIFTTNQASKLLYQLALTNSTQSEFIFYTDGSVKNISTEQCTMGIG